MITRDIFFAHKKRSTQCAPYANRFIIFKVFHDTRVDRYIPVILKIEIIWGIISKGLASHF